VFIRWTKKQKHDAQGEAVAGKTAGGVRFSLIFLFLFVSRQKEKKEIQIRVGVFIKSR